MTQVERYVVTADDITTYGLAVLVRGGIRANDQHALGLGRYD